MKRLELGNGYYFVEIKDRRPLWLRALEFALALALWLLFWLVLGIAILGASS